MYSWLRISPFYRLPPVGSCCPLQYRGYLVSWGPVHQLLVLMSVYQELFKILFCAYKFTCFPYLPPTDSQYQVLGWGSWSIWSWVLCIVRDKGFGFILLPVAIQFVQHYFWKILSFLQCVFWACFFSFFRKTGSCSCMKLNLSSVSVPLTYVSVFMLVICCVYCCSSVV